MWFDYMVCQLLFCMITCCVSCCAKCQFPPFLPFSSISQPPSWKMLPFQKTPENSTLRAYHTKMRYLSYKYLSKSCLLCQTDFLDHKNRSIYNGRYITRVTHYAIFCKHHLPHHSKYHLLNYPYYTNYFITYSLQLYRYYNTVIIL